MLIVGMFVFLWFVGFGISYSSCRKLINYGAVYILIQGYINQYKYISFTTVILV